MSHCIYYRTQAIKLPSINKVIIVAESGDNNVYDTDGRGNSTRRARDWKSVEWISNRSILTSPSEITAGLKKISDDNFTPHNPDYSHNSFGSYECVALRSAGNYCSLKEITSFFVNAAKSALTVEELGNRNITVSVHYINYVDGRSTRGGGSILSEAGLLQRLDEYKTAGHQYVWVSVSDKAQSTRAPKTSLPSTEKPWIIELHGGRYYVCGRSKMSPHKSYANRYASKAATKRLVEKYQSIGAVAVHSPL